MRVMITGATGFIGGHATALAIERGHEVCALVRAPRKLRDVMASFGVAVPRHVTGDMTDADAVAEALEGAGAVIHCAAVVSLPPRDSNELAASNAGTTLLTLSSARPIIRSRPGGVGAIGNLRPVRRRYTSANCSISKVCPAHMIRRGPLPGSSKPTTIAARSRTSISEMAAVRVGIIPLFANCDMPSPVSPKELPAGGPTTPLG